MATTKKAVKKAAPKKAVKKAAPKKAVAKKAPAKKAVKKAPAKKAAPKKAAPKKTGPRKPVRRKKIRLPKKMGLKLKTRTAARKSQNPRSLKPRNPRIKISWFLAHSSQNKKTADKRITKHLSAAQFFS